MDEIKENTSEEVNFVRVYERIFFVEKNMQNYDMCKKDFRQ